MTPIVDHIHRVLAPLFPGFRFDEGGEGFVREIPTGSQKILMPLVDLNPRYLFSLLCSIRLDEVEDICNQFNPAPRRYHAMTETTTTPIEYFTERTQFVVDTIEDVDEAARDLAPVSKLIVQFMDRHQDKEALHRAFRSADHSRFDISVQPGRAMRELVLARLCNDADFPTIVTAQKVASASWSDTDRERFSALVEYLERLPS